MIAWFLNFDADDELGDPSARTPGRAAIERARALADRPEIRALLAPGDVIVPDPPRDPPLPRGAVGRAWCPTPRAIAALSQAGATLPRAPSFEILRRVNHRRFSFDLGRALLGTTWAATRAEIDRAIARPSPTGLWLLRRPFGFAGRGRLRLDPSRRDPTIDRWIDRSIRSGEGVEIAPWVDRLADFALHGHVSEGGEIALGEPTAQRCDDAGAWIESALARPEELDPRERETLFHEVQRVAEALRDAGYFGPFGIDAFRYRDGDATRFEPRCEINARYSMGWATGMAGMGEARPDR